MSDTATQIQQDLALLGVCTQELRELDKRLIRQLPTEQAAYRHCIANSAVWRDDADLADLIGISRCVFNRAKNGDHYAKNYTLSRAQQEDLQRVCGNLAIDQWAESYRARDLNCQRDKAAEIAELRQRLLMLEGGA